MCAQAEIVGCQPASIISPLVFQSVCDTVIMVIMVVVVVVVVVVVEVVVVEMQVSPESKVESNFPMPVIVQLHV
jgi:hypothetical protein